MEIPKALAGIDGLICDLDGVLYRGEQPIPGAAETVDRLRRGGIRVAFVTNNAAETVEQRLVSMQALGIHATPEELITSAVVTAEYLAAEGWKDSAAFMIGKDGLRHALAGAGIRITDGSDAHRPDLVVVASDDRFTFDAMSAAATFVREGAHFVAANDDATYPAPDGLLPGAGAIVASIVTASGRTPVVIGKPHRPMMEAAARRLEGCRRIAVVGDQPATDLAGGREMGWATVLVLSGVTDAEEAASLGPSPDLVVPSIVELGDLLLG